MTPRTGLLLLRAGLVTIGAFLVGAGGWIALQAVRNPDVRTRRPRSLDADIPFDHAFWSPLLWTVVVGALAVAAVLWVAHQRLRRGDDLFGQRHGRGLRRRGERAFPSDLP